MPYADLCLRSTAPETLEMATTLGFSQVAILLDFKPGVFETINTLRGDLPAAFGILLRKQIKPKAKDMRQNIELIASQGQEREAAETPEVDLLFPHEINYIIARLAKKNHVTIVFDFNPILHASKRSRGDLLGKYATTAQLVRKYKVPFLLTSGARSPWDVRSPSDLIAFGKVLGFNERACKQALSGSLIKKNAARLSKNWVAPGVTQE